MRDTIKQAVWKFWNEENGSHTLEIMILGVAFIAIATILKDKVADYIVACFEMVKIHLVPFSGTP